jgi:RNA polymerase sigma-70 factor (ECF subfamily)
MENASFRANEKFEWMVKTYKDTVYGVALTHTGSPADADDVFQEVFALCYRKNPLFADAEHCRAWLIRTTLNFARRVTSSSWRKKTVPLDAAENKGFEFALKEENRVFSALQSLRPKYRRVLYLFYFEELPTEQIARILKEKPGTVRMQLSRGRELVRSALKGEYFDEE